MSNTILEEKVEEKTTEAIELGDLTISDILRSADPSRQAFGDFFDGENYCALGAILTVLDR